MRRLPVLGLLLLATVLGLSACGVVVSYRNNVDKLNERLSPPMTAAEVMLALGEPVRVIDRDDKRTQVWEYRLYPRYHWAKELLVCPFTAWLGGCLFYPSIGVSDPNYPPAYYVVFYELELCVWGTLESVSASTTCHAPQKVSRRSVILPADS